MVTARKRNKVMMLDKKSYDPTLIEDPALFTVEVRRYQKYSELLKNSVQLSFAILVPPMYYFQIS